MSTLLPLRINVNVNGIPTISSNSVSVNTAGDVVSFDFNNHPNVGSPFRGLIIVRHENSFRVVISRAWCRFCRQDRIPKLAELS